MFDLNTVYSGGSYGHGGSNRRNRGENLVAGSGGGFGGGCNGISDAGGSGGDGGDGGDGGGGWGSGGLGVSDGGMIGGYVDV